MSIARALLFVALIGLSACAGAVATPTATMLPAATVTVSSEELTAAVRFRPTLPATFTPTATATATATPTATFTPTVTLTPSIVPESALCEQFAVALDLPDESVYRLRPVALQMVVRYSTVTIRFVVTDAESGAEIVRFTRPGGRLHLEILLPFEFPREGRYLWSATLFDVDRTDLCPLNGSFVIDKTAATATPEMTAEVTAEVTAEATEE